MSPLAEERAAPITALVAADDPVTLEIVRRPLLDAGHAVRAADLGDALRADHGAIDVAVVAPSWSDRLDLVRALKARRPGRPVIVLGATDHVDERIAAFEAGADDVLIRPCFGREIVHRVALHARRRRQVAEIERLRRDADHLRVLTSEASALLAHDLNNGLAVVRSNVEYVAGALAGPIEADDEVADAASSAQRALLRMTTLVRNFVDIARIEDDALRPNRGAVDVAELARSLARIHMPRRVTSGVELVLELPPVLIADVDPILFERILHNLLNNAARYVNRGGRIRVAGEVDDVGLCLRVANSGARVPEAVGARIFEKYGHGADRRAQSGMGLYFCRLAAEAHGGTIALGAAPGYDVEFEVRIPRAIVDAGLGLRRAS